MPFPDHFALLAPFYDRLIPLAHTDTLCQHLDLPSAGLLLDVGGGTGRVAAALAPHTAGVLVVDESLAMLRQAAEKTGLLPLAGRAEALPFPDETFPRLLIVDAWHHLADHDRAAAELWRILAPGGLLLIEEPDIRTWAVRGIALFEKLTLMRSHFSPPAAIAARFPQAHTRIHIDGFNAWIVISKGTPA
ncbi:MAG: hypothetical protein Fur0018_20770 [Anaerolineales bacterium]